MPTMYSLHILRNLTYISQHLSNIPSHILVVYAKARDGDKVGDDDKVWGYFNSFSFFKNIFLFFHKKVFIKHFPVIWQKDCHLVTQHYFYTIYYIIYY